MMPDNQEQEEQDGWAVSRTDDGLVRVLVRDGQSVDVFMLESILARHKRIAPDRQSPVLYYVTPRPPFDPEILGFISRRDVRDHVAAVGAIVESAAIRTAASIFLGFVDPPFPVRLFESEESAIAWLDKFAERAQE